MQLLETDRLLLRPFTLDDAEGLYAYASHPEVGPPAGWRPHRSVEESRQVIENIFIPSDALAVLRKSDGRLIGSAGFVDRHRTELGTPSEEIGYSLARDCWGQGLIPEAVKEIIRHAFADLGYQALWAAYYDGNRKSKRVMQKCGMTYRLSRIEAVEQLGETRLAHYFAVTRRVPDCHYRAFVAFLIPFPVSLPRQLPFRNHKRKAEFLLKPDPYSALFWQRETFSGIHSFVWRYVPGRAVHHFQW